MKYFQTYETRETKKIRIEDLDRLRTACKSLPKPPMVPNQLRETVRPGKMS